MYYCRACAWLTSKAARRLRGELGAPRRTIAEAMELDGTLAAERAARTARTEARYAARRLPRQEDRTTHDTHPA